MLFDGSASAMLRNTLLANNLALSASNSFFASIELHNNFLHDSKSPKPDIAVVAAGIVDSIFGVKAPLWPVAPANMFIML